MEKSNQVKQQESKLHVKAESRSARVWQNVAMPKHAFSAAGLRRALVIKLRHHGDVLLVT